MIFYEAAFICLVGLVVQRSDGLQCYSCRGSASNEVEANIRCLQDAYLEDCDEFYAYYSEVEDQNVLSYEYYDYEKENLAERGKKQRGRPRPRDGRPRGHRRETTNESQRQSQERARERPKRQTKSEERINANTRKVKNDVSNFKGGFHDTDADDYSYYYPDYNYTYDDVALGRGTHPPPGGDGAPTGSQADKAKPSAGDATDGEEKLELPKDPEHHCYSRTIKKAWESYAVEKGCKKITYCNNLIEKNPEWSNPWNFCCDKARCNAKLVKDKPQRIFGMGCRQTDDCIQGMTSRPVCPNWFKSCPKISAGLVKMECRAKSGTKKKYLYTFKEKKCYCAPGYRPKGPICTKNSSTVLSREGLFSIALIQTFYLIMPSS